MTYDMTSDSSDETGGPLHSVSRRSLMKQAGFGAVAVGVLAGTPFGRSELHGASMPAVPAASSVEGPVIAHVRDMSKGLVDVFMGERVVTVTDHALARSLTHIASS
jgi:hypothetical protein